MVISRTKSLLQTHTKWSPLTVKKVKCVGIVGFGHKNVNQSVYSKGYFSRYVLKLMDPENSLKNEWFSECFRNISKCGYDMILLNNLHKDDLFSYNSARPPGPSNINSFLFPNSKLFQYLKSFNKLKMHFTLLTKTLEMLNLIPRKKCSLRSTQFLNCFEHLFKNHYISLSDLLSQANNINNHSTLRYIKYIKSKMSVNFDFGRWIES